MYTGTHMDKSDGWPPVPITIYSTVLPEIVEAERFAGVLVLPCSTPHILMIEFHLTILRNQKKWTKRASHASVPAFL